MQSSITVLLLVLLCCTSSAQLADDTIASLVAAERTFAASSVKEGMKTAFLQFLSDDAWLFRPGPVNGKAYWQDRQESGGRLEWWPTFADAAISGDLGYTFGPWKFTAAQNLDQPPVYGYFVSVWKKEGPEWKVVIDLGITTPAASGDTHLVVPFRPPAIAGRNKIESLLQLDRYFSGISSRKGAEQSFQQFLASDACVFLPGQFPLAGTDTIRAGLVAAGNTFTWMPTASEVSDALDLGYTYGTYELQREDKEGRTRHGHYVNIWRRQVNGAWKVVLHIRSPQGE